MLISDTFTTIREERTNTHQYDKEEDSRPPEISFCSSAEFLVPLWPSRLMGEEDLVRMS